MLQVEDDASVIDLIPLCSWSPGSCFRCKISLVDGGILVITGLIMILEFQVLMNYFQKARPSLWDIKFDTGVRLQL